jgi:hypothetical protein
MPNPVLLFFLKFGFERPIFFCVVNGGRSEKEKKNGIFFKVIWFAIRSLCADRQELKNVFFLITSVCNITDSFHVKYCKIIKSEGGGFVKKNARKMIAES